MIITAYGNTVISGKLLREPEVKQLRDSTFVSFAVAYDIDREAGKNENGYYPSKIMRVSAFSQMATEAMMLHKGDFCVVFGIMNKKVGNNGKEYSNLTADAILMGVAATEKLLSYNNAQTHTSASQYGAPTTNYVPPARPSANDFSMLDGMDEQLPW